MVKQAILDIGSQATGVRIEIPYFAVKGTDPKAPKAYLQAGLHGGELQGQPVLMLLLDHLAKAPPLGDITIVPFANPLGTNHRVGVFTQGRFDPVSGDNWNRLYWNLVGKGDEQIQIADFVREFGGRDAAEMRAEFRTRLRALLESRAEKSISTGARLCLALQTLALEADLVLDLHCALDSPRHVYIPEYAEALGQALGIPFGILIPNLFGGALDEAVFHPWWSLAEELKRTKSREEKVWVDAFTVELGGDERADFAEAERDLAGVLQCLAQRGVVAEVSGARKTWREPSEKMRTSPLDKYITVHAPEGGIVDWSVRAGDSVKHGDTLAKIHRFDHKSAGSPHKFDLVKAPVSGTILVKHSTGSIQSGMELCKILCNA